MKTAASWITMRSIAHHPRRSEQKRFPMRLTLMFCAACPSDISPSASKAYSGAHKNRVKGMPCRVRILQNYSDWPGCIARIRSSKR